MLFFVFSLSLLHYFPPLWFCLLVLFLLFLPLFFARIYIKYHRFLRPSRQGSISIHIFLRKAIDVEEFTRFAATAVIWMRKPMWKLLATLNWGQVAIKRYRFLHKSVVILRKKDLKCKCKQILWMQRSDISFSWMEHDQESSRSDIKPQKENSQEKKITKKIFSWIKK